MGRRFICNTSGSGKTRRIMEGLTEHWGFYLVAQPDVNDVGVTDLSKTLRQGTLYAEWVSDLRPLSPEQQVNQSDCNRRIIHKLMNKLLAARVVVFELFLKLAIEVDGSILEKHKRIWLLFQSFDQLDPQVRTPHPFVQVIKNCLSHASDQALETLVGRLDHIRAEYLSFSNFIIALDEAQAATTSFPRAFMSSCGNVFRSVLREIVNV